KPKDGKLIAGEVQIEGTATCPDFSRYTLSFAPEGDPENWTQIGEYQEPVKKGLLGTWDTSVLPDGPFHLRLTVFSTSGPKAQDQIGVGIDNNPPHVSISSPPDGSVVGETFDVVGTVTDAYLHHWKLFEKPASPLLLAHLDGSTVNERDSEEGTTTGEPSYEEAKFSQGLHVDGGEGLTYSSKKNIDKDRGTIEMWVVPDWEEGDTASHILLQTKTEDPENPTDCIRIAAEEGALTFTAYDPEGNPLSCSLLPGEAQIERGVPFHLGATWSGGNITLAVNGFSSSEPQGKGTGIISSLGKHIYVGFCPGLGQEAHATIDELAIYDYARPLTSLRADYLAENPKNADGEKTLVSEGREPVEDSLLGTAETTVSPGEALTLTLSARDRAKRKSETTSRVFADNPTPLAEITSPAEGEEICGKGQEIAIKGTAFDMDLASYTLAFKQGSDPNAPGEWTEIRTSSDHVWRDVLGTWSLAGVPEGEYNLRLEVKDGSGKTATAYRSVLIYAPPFAEITWPEDGQVVTCPFEVRGTARSALIDRYDLAYRERTPSFLCHFDGNTTNERDGDSGELSGSPHYAEGKFGQGLFLGQNDCLSYPAQGNISKDGGTLEMWVTHEWSLSEETPRVLFSTEPPDPESMANILLLWQNEETLFFCVFDEDQQPKMAVCPINEKSFPRGVPSHVAATWSDGDIHLYLNWMEYTPQGPQPGTGVVSQMGEHFYVGSFIQPGVGAEAVIDELSIYDFERPRADIIEDSRAKFPKSFADWNVVASGDTQVEDGTLGTVEVPSLPGEEIELKLTVTDRTGETAEDSVKLIIDAPTPTAEIDRPAEGQHAYGKMTITGTATDIDFESYRLMCKEGTDPEGPTPWIPVCGPETTIVVEGTLGEWDTRELVTGNYVLRLEVRDRSGKTATCDRVVYVNNEPPTAEITFPQKDSLVSGVVEIEGSAYGYNFASYRLEYKEGHDPEGPYGWLPIGEAHYEPVQDGVLETWDTTQLTEGPYLIRLTVSALHGVESSSCTVPVNVDNTPPEARITSPDGSRTLTGLVRVEGTATDRYFKQYMLEYSSSENPSEWLLVKGPVSNPVSEGLLGWWNTEELADGSYYLRLTATEMAGNESMCTVAVELSNPPGYVIEGTRLEPEGAACLEPGETVDFMTVGRDTQGNDHILPATYEVLGGIGTIDESGRFTATSCGHGFVRAVYDSFSCDAPVSVVTMVESTVLDQDTTWGPAQNPWVVDGWVVVPDGVTLTLEPGTVVKFVKRARRTDEERRGPDIEPGTVDKFVGGGFYVEGTLVSTSLEGEDEIILTSLEDDTVMGDTNADGDATSPQPGDWSALYFAPGATSVPLERTQILYGGAETHEDIIGERRVDSEAAVATCQREPSLRSCTIRYSPTGGLAAVGGNLTLEGNLIDNIAVCCVWVYNSPPGGSSILRGNRISGMQGGIFAFRVDNLVIESNTVSGLKEGVGAGWVDNLLIESNSLNNVEDSVIIFQVQGGAIKANDFNSCSRGATIYTGTAPGEIEVSGNTLTSCTVGIFVFMTGESESTTRVFSNTIVCPEQDGSSGLAIYAGNSGVQVSRNIISGYEAGIFAVRCNQVEISTNDISSCESGILVFGTTASGGIEVSGNTLTSCTNGIFVFMTEESESTTRVFSNTVVSPDQDGSSGLAIYAGNSGVQVSQNVISGYMAGILAGPCYQIEISTNDISSCWWGIMAYATTAPGGLDVSQNSITSSQYGLLISVTGETDSTTRVFSNTVVSPDQDGFLGLYVSTANSRAKVSQNVISGYMAGILAGPCYQIEISTNDISSCWWGI
ncbi:MAG: hypothetical protein L6427_12990, partial [Actinomycetia bacterium]|nr:hypothetical protein [Actinomycetes bacterium]